MFFILSLIFSAFIYIDNISNDSPHVQHQPASTFNNQIHNNATNQHKNLQFQIDHKIKNYLYNLLLLEILLDKNQTLLKAIHAKYLQMVNPSQFLILN